MKTKGTTGLFKHDAGDYVGPSELTLIRRTKRVRDTYYAVFGCSDCGRFFETKITSVVSGSVADCGCVSKARRDDE